MTELYSSDPEDSSLPPIVREAKERFKRTQSFEARARANYLNDIKFANADAYNGWQWPNDLRRTRDLDDKPTLTINKTQQHNLHIINDAKQNKPGIRIRPTGNGATFEAARLFNGIIHHIEYISNAQTAYMNAVEFQVETGWGYWRLSVDYSGPETFEKEIFINIIPNPLAVLIDPDAKEKDKSDMLFALIFEDIEREQFKKMHPKYKDMDLNPALGAEDEWITRDHVRIAEYFRKVKRTDKFVRVKHPLTGALFQGFLSKLDKEHHDSIIADPDTIWREVEVDEVEWFLIIGDEIAEKKIWPGKYIPVVPLFGKETNIDGEMDRKGHTRALIDPQRMYNFWSSSATEQVALQSKTPYIAPAEAIEGYETYWESANVVNHSVLPYNGLDDEGNPIAPPSRQMPPEMARAYIDGLQIASNEMMMVSGQYQAMMGAPSNERSGKAITERQRQGDNATYHFIDNLGNAIRLTGKMLIDLIPKIYTEKRIMQIMAEDGEDIEVEIDPRAQQSLVQHVDEDGKVIKRIFNPNVGRFEVQSDIGPDYGTGRQQTFEALTTIISQAPQLMSVIGDLLLRAADFPMADEAAQRLKRMTPPQALGQGPTAQEQQLQQQVQQLQQLLGKLTFENQKHKVELKGKDQLRDIDAYKAETDRMKVLAAGIDPEEIAKLVTQLLVDSMATPLAPIEAQNNQQAPTFPQGTLPLAPLHSIPPGVRIGEGGQGFIKNMAGNPNFIPVGNIDQGIPHPFKPGKVLRRV